MAATVAAAALVAKAAIEAGWKGCIEVSENDFDSNVNKY